MKLFFKSLVLIGFCLFLLKDGCLKIVNDLKKGRLCKKEGMIIKRILSYGFNFYLLNLIKHKIFINT